MLVLYIMICEDWTVHTVGYGEFSLLLHCPSYYVKSLWDSHYYSLLAFMNSGVLSSTVLNWTELKNLEQRHCLMLWEWTRA